MGVLHLLAPPNASCRTSASLDICIGELESCGRSARSSPFRITSELRMATHYAEIQQLMKLARILSMSCESQFLSNLSKPAENYICLISRQLYLHYVNDPFHLGQ